MPTLVFDPLPAALEQLLAERAKLASIRRDEVWQAVWCMIPAADRQTRTGGEPPAPSAWPRRRTAPDSSWPGQSGSAHGVGEVVLVDTVQWWALDGGAYRPTERSAMIDTDVVRLADRIDWRI